MSKGAMEAKGSQRKQMAKMAAIFKGKDKPEEGGG